MIKNTVSSTAARLAAAALCVAAAGSLSAETINLTAAANAAGCLEYGYGSQNGDTAVPQFIFTESSAGTTADRYIGTRDLRPNYLAVHFTDRYETGNLLKVNRLLIGTGTAQSNYAVSRRLTSIVLQGSNTGADFSTGVGKIPLEGEWHDGWTDIVSFSEANSTMTWTWAGEEKSSLYYFDSGTFENEKAYRYYRLRIVDFLSGSFPEFTQFRLYGEVVSLEPAGLTATAGSDFNSATVQLGADTFCTTDANATATVTLDYGTDSTFADSSYETVVVAENIACPEDGWTRTVTLTGLAGNTAYYGRYTVVNSYGVSKTETFSFTTPSPAVGPISIDCVPESSAADVLLTVNGFCVGSAEVAGSVYIDYGTDGTFPSEGTTQIVVGENLLSPAGLWQDTVRLDGLASGTTYYVRLTVRNGRSEVATTDASFTTMSEVFVSAAGSDEDGDGSAEHPYRTITKAITENPVRPFITLGEGTYSVSLTDETFPIQLPSGSYIKGAGCNVCRIDGADAGVSLICVTNGGEACRISGIHFANTGVQAPVYTESSDLYLQGCSFSQTVHHSGQTESIGALMVNGACTATVEDCDFSLGLEAGTAFYRHWIIRSKGAVGSFSEFCNVNVRRSTFRGNRVASGLIGGCEEAPTRYVIEDCVFSDNIVSSENVEKTGMPGSCVFVSGGIDRSSGNIRYGSLRVDRCKFLRNTANAVVGVRFLQDDSVRVQNSLFRGNAMYNNGSSSAHGTIVSYLAYMYVGNCTFIGNAGRYCERGGATFSNVIFENEGDLFYNTSNKMWLYGAILHNTAYGYSSQVQTDAAYGEILVVDPCFSDDEGHLAPYSPAIDAGVSRYGTFDLDGNVRAIDSLLTGVAAPDFGCFESTYNAETVPTFRPPGRGQVTQPAGRQAEATITLAAAEDVVFPITATVMYPDGFSGPSTLTFVSDTATLTYTPPHSIGAFGISFSADGVVGGTLLVNVVDDSIKLFGDTLKILRSSDGIVEVPVSMSSDGAVAPEDISVEIVSLTGDGTTTVEWSSGEGRFIARGEGSSAAKLVMTPGSGHNVLTLRSSGSFAESGTETLVVNLVADPDAIYVSAASGSDATGIGTDSAPFKSVTKALSYASAGDTVRIAPGTYSAAATDEAFPFTKGGVAFIGEPEGGQSVTLDGANSVDNLFRLDGNESALSVRNMTLANTHEAIAYLQDGYIAMTNCAIVQTQSNNDAPAIAYLFRASKIEMADSTCETDLENLSRQSAFSLMTTQEDITEESRQSDRWIKVVRCRFRNLRFERALATSLRDNGVPYLAMFSECDFSALRLWIGRPTGIPGGSGNVYMYSIFHLPAGTRFGNDLFKLTVDRSRFVSCKADATASVSHCLPPEITNCIFVDMTNGVSLVHGNHIVGNAAASVRNCTFIRTTGSVVAYGESTNPISAEARNCIFVDSEIATHASSRPLTISDSIIYNSARGDYWDGTVTTDDNVLVDVDPKLRKIDVVGTDPLFNASFGASSPAFDAGNDSYAAGDFDLLGNPRVAGKHVDLGAIECQGRPALILIVR